MATISSFPHTIDLSLTLVAGNGRTTATYSATGGWNNGPQILCISQPDNNGDGSLGQGYAGYANHVLPAAVRRLNLRVLVKLNHSTVPRCKWHVLRQHDGTTEYTDCRRFIVEDRLAQGDHLVRRPISQQGVCTSFRNASNVIIMPNLANLDWNDYIGQWICLEYEADLDTGFYKTFVTTQDGAANGTLWSQVDISDGSPGNPSSNPNQIETVPKPAGWRFSQFDGIFWDDPDAGQYGAYVTAAEVNTTYIGPPSGFVTGGPQSHFTLPFIVGA